MRFFFVTINIFSMNIMLPVGFIIMSEEERLRRKKLRMRPKMIERAYKLGLLIISDRSE